MPYRLIHKTRTDSFRLPTYYEVIQVNNGVAEVERGQTRDTLIKQGFYEIPMEPVVKTAPAPPEEDITKADLNYAATLWASNGMGRVGEEVLLALDRLGLKINIQPIILKKEGLQERTFELLEKKYEPSEKTLLFSIPEHLEKHHTKETFLHVPWDTTKAPDKWVSLINKYCRKVYPDSAFTEKVFEDSGITVPMMTIKHGVRADRFPEMARVWDKTFTFLTCGDLSLRKGTDVLIEAFLKAFPTESNVKLIIKSNKPLDWGRIPNPNDKRIEVITDRLSHEEFLQLFKRANCFVLPSRSEGFGLPILEAMATGLPVIFHNWGGMSMMVNDKYNFPISSEDEIPAPKWHYPEEYSTGGGIGNWRNPDKEYLGKLMNYLYVQRDISRKQGERAAKWVRRSWDWDTPVRRMWRDMQGYSPSSWGDFYAGDTMTKNLVQSSVNSHKELFQIIGSFYPDKIVEAGCGTGEMSAYLSWDAGLIEGREVNKHRIKDVVALDADKKVIELAKTNLDALDAKRVRLVQGDAFKSRIRADVIFAQGMLEHFSNTEMRRLVDHQLKYSPVVIHSIPNDKYTNYEFGDERHLTDKEYYGVFEGFDLVIYRYWNDTQTILVFKRERDDGAFPKASIIMPVRNFKEMTIKAIEAVREHTKDYELIVIDNGSSDGIGEWLDDQEDIRTVHLPDNIGIPKAKNLGIAMAKGGYVCFLDNDTKVGKKWLDTLLSVFKDPTVGFTGHAGYNVDVSVKEERGTMYETKERVQWCSHSVFAFPRELVKVTGLLFDKGMWCLEDVDQCCRIRNQGYVGKLPDKKVNVIHHVSKTARLPEYQEARNEFAKWRNRFWSEWGEFLKNKKKGPKIDIGVGDAPCAGYLHVDIQKKHHVEIVADTKNLPFDDNSIGEVRNAHLVEHFTRTEVDEVISEWVRVLEVGGTLRVICPDFRKVCQQVTTGEVSVNQGLLWIYGGQLDKYDFHYWSYTPETLKEKFEKHGLTNVQWGHTQEGWLEVTGNKTQTEKKPEVSIGTSVQKPPEDIKVGFFMSHSHIYGGGENLTFQLLKVLQETFPRMEVISEHKWFVDPQVFGIDLKPLTMVESGKFDLFINQSHFQLSKPMGNKNIAFIFYPQFDWKEDLKKYDTLVTLSEFCSDEIKKKWEINSMVAYPPTDITKFKIEKKKKQILAVGRFFWVAGGNNKNQHILVEAFKKLPKDWKLVFVGSVQDEKYYSKVKEAAAGFNIEFKQDVPFEELVELYAESSTFWHAAGFEAPNPSGYEHFGMVATESLASGCRTLVYNAGGIAQIKGVETWNAIEELANKTLRTESRKPEELRELAKEYSFENFKKAWWGIVNETLKVS